MEFGELIKQRHSIRAYKDRPVEPAKLDRILCAAERAPSAGNLQAYRVAVVQDLSARRALARAALGQDFVALAPLVLAFLADPAASGRTYGTRGETLYAVQDATIACAYAQLAACDAGLGACWVGAFDDGRAREALGIGESLRPIALLLVGYPAEAGEATPRRPMSETTLPMERP